MKHNFNHFVITRFNLKSGKSSWKADKNHSKTLSTEWLEHRINLFKNYCLPSLINQSNKNFRWLIYFDSNTTDKFKKIIEALVAKYVTNIILKYVDGYDEFVLNYTHDVLELKQADTDYVITTRVDNDDALHKDYIDIVQKQFANQEFMAINFIKIFNYRIVKPEKLFVNYMFSNQFISLIEKPAGGKITGCYGRGDRFWNKKGKITQIANGTFCMEIIHEKNLLNDLKGFPTVRKKDLKAFQIAKYSINNSVRDYFLIWKMCWKKYIIYHLKYNL